MQTIQTEAERLERDNKEIEGKEKRIKEAYRFLQGFIAGTNPTGLVAKELDTLYIECHEYIEVLKFLKGKVLY